MGEYLFGVGRGRVTEARAEQIDAVASKYECSFTFANIPGNGPKYWFAGPHRGEPFNDEMARNVIAACEAAGVWPIDD